ncbi:MAG: GAP family protein [Gordonia sp. (in: high G+C Gram-positive bacteria)]|uniref:GAP family protein n=1 Tax=Gordonia TaxID=2053 RepID=UPI00326522C2
MSIAVLSSDTVASVLGPIGDTLPSAVGIALSPVPIIAVILMLMTPKARSTSTSFMVGWLAGITVATILFSAVAGLLPDSSDGPDLGASIVRIILGVGLLILAVRQWRGRPSEGETAELPTWMQAIDTLSPLSAMGTGFALAAINPKNLLLAAGAGIAFNQAPGLGAAAVSITVYVVIAGASVWVPVVALLTWGERLLDPLERLRRWLTANNAAIVAVVLLVLGAVLLGKGLATL